jgi:hypothetical protein
MARRCVSKDSTSRRGEPVGDSQKLKLSKNSSSIVTGRPVADRRPTVSVLNHWTVDGGRIETRWPVARAGAPLSLSDDNSKERHRWTAHQGYYRDVPKDDLLHHRGGCACCQQIQANQDGFCVPPTRLGDDAAE